MGVCVRARARVCVSVCFPAPIAGYIINRHGCRTCCFLGGLLCFVGYTSSAFVTSVLQLFFTYGLTAGIQSSLLTPIIYIVSSSSTLAPTITATAAGVIATSAVAATATVAASCIFTSSYYSHYCCCRCCYYHNGRNNKKQQPLVLPTPGTTFIAVDADVK